MRRSRTDTYESTLSSPSVSAHRQSSPSTSAAASPVKSRYAAEPTIAAEDIWIDPPCTTRTQLSRAQWAEKWKVEPSFWPSGEVCFIRNEEATKVESLGILSGSDSQEGDLLYLTELGVLLARIDLPLDPQLSALAIFAAFLPPFCSSEVLLNEILRGISMTTTNTRGALPWTSLARVTEQLSQVLQSLSGQSPSTNELSDMLRVIQQRRKDFWRHGCDFRTAAHLLALFIDDPGDPALRLLYAEGAKLEEARTFYDGLKWRLGALQKLYPSEFVRRIVPKSLRSIFSRPLPTSPSSIQSAIFDLLFFASGLSLAIRPYYPQTQMAQFGFERLTPGVKFVGCPVLVLAPKLGILWDPPYYAPAGRRETNESNPFFTSLHPFVDKTDSSTPEYTAASTLLTSTILSYSWYCNFPFFALLMNADRTRYIPQRPLSLRDHLHSLFSLALSSRVLLTPQTAQLLNLPYSDGSVEVKKKRVVACYMMIWLVEFLEALKEEKEGEWRDPIGWMEEDWKVEKWDFKWGALFLG